MSAKSLTTQLTTWTKCQRSKQLRQHGVSKRSQRLQGHRQDYADYFWKTLKVSHRFKRNNQVKKSTWVCLHFQQQ